MLKKVVRAAYSLDFRSLALFRILVGILIILDLIFRSEDLSNHYTDLGVLPTLAWKNFVAFDWAFSFHAWNGSVYYIAFVFLIHGIIAALFTIGVKTKLMTILLFIFTCSLQDRIWVVNNGGDDLLRLLLFICIFLPLNRRASVDYALSDNQPNHEKAVLNLWCVYFLFQLLGPYYFSALLKNSPAWNESFTATYFALRLKIFAMPLGQWLLQYEGFLKLMTFFAIWLEWAGSILVLFNFVFFKYISSFRTIAVFIFMGFHFALIFILDLGMFPIWFIFFWTAFFPTSFWEFLISKFYQNDKHRLEIYYDRDCGFCLKMVLIMKSFFLLPTTTIEPVQNHEKYNVIMEKENSWVVVNNKRETFTKFEGIIAVFRASPLLKYFVLSVDNLLIRRLGGVTYHWVSYNRKKVSIMTKYFRGANFNPLKFNPYTNVFAVFCMVCVLYWNLGHLQGTQLQNPIIKKSVEYLHLTQKWDLFSPFPREVNTWLEIQGVTEKGEFWDLLTNKPYTGLNTSDNFHKSITNKQWRKYYLVIMDNQFYLKLYAEYLCRKWNLKKDRPVNTRLQRFKIFLYKENNLLNGQVANSSRKLAWSHYCF